MGTKTLRKFHAAAAAKPATAAARLRKKSLYVMAFFAVPATIALTLMLLGIWVPGMAWLE